MQCLMFASARPAPRWCPVYTPRVCARRPAIVDYTNTRRWPTGAALPAGCTLSMTAAAAVAAREAVARPAFACGMRAVPVPVRKPRHPTCRRSTRSSTRPPACSPVSPPARTPVHRRVHPPAHSIVRPSTDTLARQPIRPSTRSAAAFRAAANLSAARRVYSCARHRRADGFAASSL